MKSETLQELPGLTLFEHQKLMLNHHLSKLNTFDLSEVGTGKTAPMVLCIDQLIKRGKITSVLLLAPNSILQNWENEIKIWSNLKAVILQGSKQKRKELLQQKADIFVLNFEGLRVIYEDLATKNFDIIVADELHHLKAPNGSRKSPTQSWCARELAKKARARKGMTGTIITNDLMDVWAIAEFIDRNIFKSNAWGFRYRFLYDQNEVTCRVESPRDGPYVKIFFSGVVAREIELELEKAGFKYVNIASAGRQLLSFWQADRNDKTAEVGEDFRKRNYLKFPKMIAKPGAAEEVNKILAPYSIRFEKKDVLKWLPPMLFEKRYIDLTAEETKAYKELTRYYVTELKGEPFAALQVLARTTKLLEIANGFAYRDLLSTYRFEHNRKIIELKELLQEIGNQRVCIWVSFRENIFMLQEALPEAQFIYGDTPNVDRQSIIDRFNRNEFNRLVVTAGCVGEGQNIFAPYVISFSRGWKLGDWLQSLGRHHRPGAEQFDNITVIILIANVFAEIKVMKSLDNKEDLLKTLNPKSAMELLQ